MTSQYASGVTLPRIEVSGRVLELTGEKTPLRDLLRDLGVRRSLLPMLANRDFRARYRSSSLGLAWAVLLPIVQGAILAVVFTHFVRVETGTSYPVFIMAGMTAWTYVNSVIISGTTSIVDQSDIAGRIYFPRLFLPGMGALALIPGLVAGLIVVVIIGLIFGVTPTWQIIGLPATVLLAFTLTYAASAVLALLNVYFRDVRYIVTALMQALLYLTPIIYPLTFVSRFRNLLAINPVTGIVEMSRWSFTANGTDPLLVPVLGTLAWIVGLTIAALLAYSRHERLACDRL